jgi:hypothetical protein
MAGRDKLTTWSASTAWAEYLAILLAGLYGFWNWPWWIGVVVPSVMLLLLGWPHWRELAAKAWRMDEHWRVLGMYWRGHNFTLVVGGHLLKNLLLTGLAFALGRIGRSMLGG